MIRLTAKVVRPNTKMAFYPRPETVTPLIEQAKSSGKLISEDSLVSKNKLTLTYVALWNSQEDLKEFNQQDLVKDFHKRRRWFEQQFDHMRTVNIEDVNS